MIWCIHPNHQNENGLALSLLKFIIRATITEISVKNSVWGPVEWVGRILPEEKKFKKKCTSFFYFFGFERPFLRYLLKTVLHCKGSGIWVDAITQVPNCCCPKPRPTINHSYICTKKEI